MTPIRRPVLRYLAVIGVSIVFGPACNTLTARATADLFGAGAPAIDEHWDYDLVGQSLPGALMQLEGLLSVDPENDTLLAQAVRAYVSYGFGWVEDEAERLRASGDTAGANAKMERVIALYERAVELAKRRFRLRHAGFDLAFAASTDEFRRWLAHEVVSESRDPELLFWTAYALGSYANSAHPTEARPERARAIAMVHRSLELDAGYYGASGSIVLAYVATNAPNATDEGAARAWEHALSATRRTNLLAQVTMAREYAWHRRHDRALYVSLLREVVAAGDVNPEMRLSNRVARHRAARYLREIAQP